MIYHRDILSRLQTMQVNVGGEHVTVYYYYSHVATIQFHWITFWRGPMRDSQNNLIIEYDITLPVFQIPYPNATTPPTAESPAPTVVVTPSPSTRDRMFQQAEND